MRKSAPVDNLRSLGTVLVVQRDGRIELTLQLWSRADPDDFEEYLGALIRLLPRNDGVLERRIADTDQGTGTADSILVLSFPDAASVEGWLRDPLRGDIEELAQRAVARSLITGSRHRPAPVDTADASSLLSIRSETSASPENTDSTTAADSPATNHSLVLGKSPVHGTGVFALDRIEQGAFIGRYFGERTAVDGRFVLWIEDDDGTWEGIDGVGDLRFLNHSRSPNVYFDGPDLYALRGLNPGEELLFDYGDDWKDTP